MTHTHTVSCDAPETDGNVHYSSYNSTLEGSNVIFWCTDRQFSTEAFTSVCHRNASWIPDPISRCSTLPSGKNSFNCGIFCTQNRKLDLHTRTVSCGAPETDVNVHYSSYNSTLEGSNVTFWCTVGQLSTEVFTSVCHRNTSWIPDPVSQCSTLTLGKNSMKCFK